MYVSTQWQWSSSGRGDIHSVTSDLEIGTTRQLGDMHVAIQIYKSLKGDEFSDDWR
jgi:hypothetical protein